MKASFVLFVAVFAVWLLGACDDGRNPEPKPLQEAVAGQSDSSRAFALMTSAEREQLRERLMREGKYDCCVRPGCTECIGSADSCSCYIAIRNDDPICGECLTGYKEGTGKLKMVSIVDLERNRARAKLKEDR